jgi:hypothetical protein
MLLFLAHVTTTDKKENCENGSGDDYASTTSDDEMPQLHFISLAQKG